jgi:hypothetical protein
MTGAPISEEKIDACAKQAARIHRMLKELLSSLANEIDDVDAFLAGSSAFVTDVHRAAGIPIDDVVYRLAAMVQDRELTEEGHDVDPLSPQCMMSCIVLLGRAQAIAIEAFDRRVLELAEERGMIDKDGKPQHASGAV